MNRNFRLTRSSAAFLSSLLVIAMVVSSAVTSRASEVQAVVVTVEGTVEFAPPGSSLFSALKAGQSLSVGSTIRTGGDGKATIKTTPGSAIELGNDSNLRLNALAFAKSGDTVTQREAHLQLKTGVVSALIDPSTPKITDFQVQTPDGAAAARGTFYAVMVANHKTYVSVERGKVGALAAPKDRNL